jgi:hypothetical protein
MNEDLYNNISDLIINLIKNPNNVLEIEYILENYDEIKFKLKKSFIIGSLIKQESPILEITPFNYFLYVFNYIKIFINDFHILSKLFSKIFNKKITIKSDEALLFFIFNSNLHLNDDQLESLYRLIVDKNNLPREYIDEDLFETSNKNIIYNQILYSYKNFTNEYITGNEELIKSFMDIFEYSQLIKLFNDSYYFQIFIQQIPLSELKDFKNYYSLDSKNRNDQLNNIKNFIGLLINSFKQTGEFNIKDCRNILISYFKTKSKIMCYKKNILRKNLKVKIIMRDFNYFMKYLNDFNLLHKDFCLLLSIEYR